MKPSSYIRSSLHAYLHAKQMLLILLEAIAFLCASLCLRVWLSRRKLKSSRGLPCPPGPKGLPLLGNIFDMPAAEEWETARQWGEQYGDLVFIQNVGTPYLFLNSYDACVDLLEKRGESYSSRPLNMMLELEGWTEFTVFLPYGDEHRKSRQLIQRFLKTALSDSRVLQAHITHKLLLRLLNNPGEFAGHIRHTTGELIMMMVYGYKAAEKDDPYIELVEKGVNALTEAEAAFLVNAVPVLQYLPEWFPRTQFLQIAKEGRRLSRAIFYEPFEMVKRQINEGSAIPSMASKMLESNTDANGHVANETLLAKTASVIYAAGADTTVSALNTFILAMVLHPEAMRRGQEELDRVVGKDSLPTMDDKPNLPFVNAICNEVLRWETVTPLAVAHCAAEDDVYNGYFIPAGTTIFPNVWAMLRNPEVYPEPDKFKPERWLPTDGKLPPLDVNKMAFGFGRRICPGRDFAQNSIFIGVASMLSAFDFEKSLDYNGAPITPSGKFQTHFIRHLEPFKCRITPRSDKIGILVQQAIESAK
ncbi:cytochrome P450 [Phellopilus nigrolimitatus]|nr:cytochrome P450 [Phellopilus nigrolimitatus]